MKNFLQISKLFHDEVMSRSSRGQVEGNTCVEHFSHKALMLLFAVFVMSIGQMWGATATISATQSNGYSSSCYLIPDGTAISAITGAGGNGFGNESGPKAKITVTRSKKTATLTFTINSGITITSFKVNGESNNNVIYDLDGTSVTIGTALTGLSKTSSMVFTLTCTDESGTSNRNTKISSIVLTYTTGGGGGGTGGETCMTFGTTSGDYKTDGTFTNGNYTIVTNEINWEGAHAKFGNNVDYISFSNPNGISAAKIYAKTANVRVTYSTATDGSTGTSQETISVSESDYTQKTLTVPANTKYIKLDRVPSTSTYVNQVCLTESEAAPSSCTGTYSFHSKNSSSTWEDPICFAQVGSSTTYMTDEVYLPTDGVSFKVGWEGSDDAARAKTSEKDWYYMIMGPRGTRGSGGYWIAGRHTTSENTGGAKGRFYLYSDNNEDNKYVGFTPTGYKLRFGKGESWTSYAFSPNEGATDEATDWRTGLVTLNSDNADYHTYVGLETSSDYVWTDHSEDDRHVFLDVTTNWGNDGVTNFAVYCWDGTGNDRWCLMTAVPGVTKLYEGWLPNTYNYLKFVRLKSSTCSFDNAFNTTGDLSLLDGKNLFTITDWGTGSWGVYEKTGKFRMWANSTSQNWYVHFYPYNVLTYNANTGSGTMTPQSVAADAGSKNVTVLANGFTAPTGYQFDHWDTAPDGSGTDYAPGATYNLTADATLYAIWSPIPVSSITVSPASKTLDVGDTQTLTATVAPATALDKAVTWSTGNGSIATVSSTGLVTAVAPGSCTITATAHDGSGVTGTCDITVNKLTPTKYSFSVDKEVLCGEETATLTLEDSEVGVTYELREDSSHPIAETQKTGTGSALTWTGLGAGTYVVYAVADATYIERQMDGSKITVSAGTATSITTQPTNQEVTVGEEATLTVEAAGTSLSYQWKESATEGGTYSDVSTGSGKTSASYRVTPAAAGTKWYKCVVTGTCGEVTTEARKIVANAAVTYTVTYVYNGADGGSQPASATGSSVSLPNPTKTGYKLQGWYTSSGSLAGAATATYNPTSNITLYALWREDDCAGGGGGGTAEWSYYFVDPDAATEAGVTNASAIFTSMPSSTSTAGSNMNYTIGEVTLSSAKWKYNNAITSGTTFTTLVVPSGYKATNLQLAVNPGGSNLNVKVYNSSDEEVGASGSVANSDGAIATIGEDLAAGTYSVKATGRNCGRFYAIAVELTPTGGGEGECYYVTYNGNGADGGFTTDEASHPSGSDVTVKTNSFTKTGYRFTGWKTEPSGGTSYAAGGTISGISSNITLYAQWSAGTLYSVTYNGNGATSGSVPVDASSPYASGSNVTVLGNTGSLALANYTFDGWATANDGTGTSYTADGTISGIAADVELFAKWKQTVTLNTGSQGSEEEKTPYIYINGAALNGFSAHSATGYTLNGYYSAASGGTKVLEADGSFAATDVTNYVTGGKWSRTDATTLYAQWRAAAGSTCYEWDATETKPQTGTNVNFGGLYLTAPNKTNVSFYSGQAADSCYDISAKAKTLYGHLNGLEIASVKFAVSSNSSDYRTIFIAFCSSTTFSTANIIEVGGYQGTVYTVNKNDAAKSEFTVSAPAGTKSFAIGRNMDGITYSESFTAGQNRYLYYLQVCSAGGGTHTISYNAGGGTGTMTSDADIADDGTKILKTNTFTAPENYSFAGWVADVAVTIGGDVKTAGTLIADGATITNITMDIALTAKWTQSITLNANTANHGTGDNTSATVMYNATALSSISHTSAEGGYKLTGYYTADTEGTKVLNSDGTFAGTDIDGWISDGKWTCTAGTRVLYAQYESSGSLLWNLGVKTEATSLTTSSKTSAFTQIAVANMTDATINGLTYTGDAKASLTGKIETTASEDGSKYVYVTFQVADGYKFTPNSVKVKVQPISAAQYVKLELTDNAATPNSISYTTASKQSKGSISTVEMTNGSSVEFTGTVTLKIFCYGTAYATDGYRLGTPITIDGDVEEACATMPSFTKMNYTTTTFTPNEDATGSPISIEGGENIDTYQWKYNTVNDRTSGTNCGTGTSLTPLTDAGATANGTRYYWCEMKNDACDITIKSPAVAITVAAAKSDATVTWTGPASTPNYGGGGYTIKATVDQSAWNGNAADLVITAPAGIRIYNVSSGTDGSSRKYVQADFDVQTSFDRSTYASNIPFTVSAAATATYNAISNDHNTAYSACAGAGEGSSYNIRMRKTVTKDGNYYHCANTDGWISPNISSSYSTGKAGTKMETDFDTVASSNTQYVWVRTYHANVNKVRIYADFRANDMTVSNVYKHTDYFTANNKYLVDYTAVYNDDEENENTGTAAQGYVDITLDEVMAANDILLVKFNDSKVRPLGAVITEGSAGSLNTHLQWSGDLGDGATVNKKTTDAYFTYSASMITENTNSLGAITYSSSVPSVATVDATGKVAMVAAGTTTIKATLAASGCYKKAEISYTLNVTEEACAIAAGTLTLTSGTESKCSSDEVTLTLTGFESGASIQWKDGDTDINNGGNYTIAKDGTTSTLTTNQPGTYSVIVTKGCFVRSNRITISNKSTEVHVTRLVKEWYIKNGRLTPDIALWELGDDCSFVSVAASSGWNAGTGLTEAELGEKVFYEKDGIVYLKGTEPYANAGAVQNYTLTLTVNDGCGNQTLTEEGKKITIHHQQNTDKHVLAFVVTGTEKGGFTAGVPSTQTTGVDLYNTIATNFDVLATNIYSTDDEQALKEYYSQFDILCVTDYPNTQTKGVNKKSYVDALGSLIDIRPILTMEAFVSKLANWKAKGISGNPKSPTTRQYTMDLQCKDHEIFAGTKLTKVGEGDEAMYRVSMVDNTKEEYVSLDATYGGGAHAEKDGYNYGGKPALQGFEFTQEMSDNDLLPIGLIEDGAGNPLQVGIERQHNMEARLMVLGINSYAMERLTDDGEKVVINALKYLMKKNAEDIADCSTSFVGGAEGHEKNWDYADNWTGNTVPLSTQKVRILADCEVSSTVYAQSVLIVTDGKYNHGSDVAAGKLTIKENGALIVGGKIQAASAPAYNRTRATTPDKLLIETSSTNQAALIFDNEEGETQATVNYHSKGYNDGSNYQFQYFAIPMDYVAINPVFANEANGNNKIYTYAWDEPSNGWERRGYYSEFYAFEGLAITTTYTTPISYTLTGNLASTAEREMTLTHSGEGSRDNIIGNSWMAPINIASLVDAFATDESVEKTVYIYCAGNDSVDGDDGEDYGNTEVAGQWLSIPMGLTTFPKWDGLKVIPAMQAYLIKVTGETTLTLNYDQMVRSTAPTALNQKLRAPKRRTALNEDKTLTRLRVADSRTHTDLYLVEGGIFSDAFDNGWEATYMPNEGASPQFYAMGVKGKMAVLATNELDGTEVGFEPGKETAYTISFKGAGNGYYLNDVKKQISTLITDGGTYSFTYEAGDDANRFYISSTPFSIPQITTGMENLDAVAPKVQKVIYNDKMYIIRGGKVFSADGQLVK